MLLDPLTEQRSSTFLSAVTVDSEALAANVRWIKDYIGKDVELMAVVKANAYGHGAAAVADIALNNGAVALAVANISEAMELRDAGIDAPILILSMVSTEAIPLALALDLRVTIYDFEQASQFQACAFQAPGPLNVHIKVDTGMGRLGVVADDAFALCEYARGQPALRLEGIYTHFSTAECDQRYASEQLSRFNFALEQLHRNGFRFRYIHAANSAAMLACRGSRFNLARPGLLLYGLNPMPGSAATGGLQPALSWTTNIAQVKTLPAGSPIGYGNTYRTRAYETIAVLPVGYADGLRRSPRTWREVLVRGLRAPLVGRVSMDKVTVNVSHIPDVQMGDEVVLLGKQGGDEISADEIAEWIGSINYDVVTSIAPRVPRTLV